MSPQCSAIRTVWAAGLLALLLIAAPMPAHAQSREDRASARPARPPLPPHAQERPRARPGYVWMQGRWRWDRRKGQYVWTPGYWQRDSRAINHGSQRSRFQGGVWNF